VPAQLAEDVSIKGLVGHASAHVKFLRMENGRAVFKLDAGRYEFLSRDYRERPNPEKT
jgi:hypothetical protein